jgi:hypothetical protein
MARRPGGLHCIILDWLTFISSLIGSLSWPVLILALVVLLRRPIAGLIPNLRELRYKDFKIEFTKRLREVEREAQRVQLPAPEALTAVDRSEVPTTFAEFIDRLAELSPRSAVTEAWRFVQTALQDALAGLGKVAPRSPRAMEEFLLKETNIDRRTLSLLSDLRALRNEAVHAPEFAIQPEQARKFGDFALRIAGALQSLGPQSS